jgi:hypothetical protein
MLPVETQLAIATAAKMTAAAAARRLLFDDTDPSLFI